PMDTQFFLAALVFGWLIMGLIIWLYLKNTIGKTGVLEKELEEKYVLKAVHQTLQEQTDSYRADLNEKEQEIIQLHKIVSAKEQNVLHLEERLDQQKEELNTLQRRLTTEFENLANKIFEEKTQKFTTQNQYQLAQILSPLKEKINDFEISIQQKYLDETKERTSLKKEIEQLKDLNIQLSEDAANLVSALKGDSKVQGDWGEFQLKTLLEKAGLEEGIHFSTQSTFTDQKGLKKRPDFIINMPDGKHLIIDSKVSLKAYEQYFNAPEKGQKSTFLKLHIESMRNHIKDLSSKNYTQLYQINTPDYLLMFVPVESAFTVAVQANNQLFMDALERNIVLVTTSTLLATMRTVAFIWKQEKQKKNVLEIARQSGLLYDKFVNFVEDLRDVGNRINQAQSAYGQAMNKLVDSKKFGDTLIGRAEKIKDLGAKASKKLPNELLE
ncbi:MAG: DNA recombination protein RmuC, partial [Bacteroidota bacterium]